MGRVDWEVSRTGSTLMTAVDSTGSTVAVRASKTDDSATEGNHHGEVSSKALDDGHVRHSAALAHCLQAVPSSTLMEDIDERRHELGAGRSKRVA